MSKLTLNESLFDDDMTFDEPSIKIFDEGHFDDYKIDEFDDDLFEYEPLARADALTDHNGEAVPEGPSLGLDSGIADTLIRLINDEWEAIQGYNNFREMILSAQNNGDGDYTEMLKVIDEVANEENLHVGQLQELLKKVSPNTESIAKGEEEAQEQLEPSDHRWINGKLEVQAHVVPSMTESANNVCDSAEDLCTLDNTDDEM
jgi:hypothetical protein